MIERGATSFVLEGETVNRANAFRPASRWADEIKRREDENVVSRIKLGALVRAGGWAFKMSQAEFGRELGLHHNMVNRSVLLAAALDDGTGERRGDQVGPGRIDWAKLDALREDDGRLPCVTRIEELLGVRTSTRTYERRFSPTGETRSRDGRDNGPRSGVASGRTPTTWRHGGGGDTEQKEQGHEAQSGQDHLDTPPGSGFGAAGSMSPARVASGQDPEPPAGGGRAATRGHRPAGSVGTTAGTVGGTASGTVGGEQMTMDALYERVCGDTRRMIDDLAELLHRPELDAGKLMAAREMFEGGLAYLREAVGQQTEAGTA